MNTTLNMLALAISLYATSALAQTTEQKTRFDQLVALYADAGVVHVPEMVDCTLSDGEQTLCISITTGPAPSNHVTGPYCPSTIESPPEEGGTWFLNDEVVVADGEFIRDLAILFNDDVWQMYDVDTGDVILVDGELGCAVAGDPNSASDYVNYCVECEVSYLDENTSETYVIPLIPVAFEGEAARIGPSPGVGLAFNGVKLDAPAPLELIEGNHTLGLMDACVGHVNPYTGYHYHGLIGCEPQVEAAVPDHEPQVAVAMDGYDIYAALDGSSKDSDLDSCNGHFVYGLGYHYHTDVAGNNQFIGCFAAQYGCALSDSSAVCDASVEERRSGPPPSD